MVKAELNKDVFIKRAKDELKFDFNQSYDIEVVHHLLRKYLLNLPHGSLKEFCICFDFSYSYIVKYKNKTSINYSWNETALNILEKLGIKFQEKTTLKRVSI